jgi:spore coat protein U-like protein
MKKLIVSVCAMGLFSAATVASHAATLTSTFHVLANVTATAACTNFGVSDINFGTLAGTTSGAGISLPTATATGSWSLSCAAATPFTMAFSAGNAGTESSSMSGRYMLNGTSQLKYQLVIVNGSNCSAPVLGVWGDGTNGTLDFAKGGGTWSGFTCAILPTQSVATTGAYSDTIVATLTY